MKQIAYIHGLNSSPVSFSYISGRLPTHASHFITYHSFQSLKSSIDEVIQQLPKDTQVTLVGHSLGGVIAAIVAADHPDKVESLITISAPFKGSHIASSLRWLPWVSPILQDICPRAAHISRCCSLELQVPTLNIITTGGNIPTLPELNDSVVTVSSQKALKFGTKVEINASHFEVLLKEATVDTIKNFIFGDDND